MSTVTLGSYVFSVPTTGESEEGTPKVGSFGVSRSFVETVMCLQGTEGTQQPKTTRDGGKFFVITDRCDGFPCDPGPSPPVDIYLRK